MTQSWTTITFTPETSGSRLEGNITYGYKYMDLRLNCLESRILGGTVFQCRPLVFWGHKIGDLSFLSSKYCSKFYCFFSRKFSIDSWGAEGCITNWTGHHFNKLPFRKHCFKGSPGWLANFSRKWPFSKGVLDWWWLCSSWTIAKLPFSCQCDHQMETSLAMWLTPNAWWIRILDTLWS